jgi:hypothetical protein
MEVYQRFDNQFIYGPISRQDVENLRVNHCLVELDNGCYIGVNEELPEFESVRIYRPAPVQEILADQQETSPQ